MQGLGPRGVWSRVRQSALMVNAIKTSRLERDQELAPRPHTGKTLIFLAHCALNVEDSLSLNYRCSSVKKLPNTGVVSVAVLENEATSEESPLTPMGWEGRCSRGLNFTGPACP